MKETYEKPQLLAEELENKDIVATSTAIQLFGDNETSLDFGE